jgi:hypothetical protein
MLKIIQHVGKHCSCDLQGEYIMAGQATNQKAKGASVRSLLLG